LGAGALLVVSAISILIAGKVLARSRAAFAAFVVLALVTLTAALASEFIGHWRSGLRPDASGYAALVYMASALQLEVVAAIVILGLFTLARCAAGRLDADRRVIYEALALLTYYAVGQGLLGLLLVHGFPRVVS
jgi:cytochrome c oxidase subunit I+III